MKIALFMATLAIAAGLLAVAFVLKSYAPLAEDYVGVMAWRECAEAYRYQHTDPKTNIVTNQPIEDKVSVCTVNLLRR